MIIIVKRRIKVDDSLKEFIFANINYRRRVWNDFVEESRKYERALDFDPIEFKTKYFRNVELPNKIYDEYCVGISEQVMKDMISAQKIIRGKKRWNSKFRFKRFDRFSGSFKVHSKQIYVKRNDGGYNFNSRVYLKKPKKVYFKVKGYRPLLEITTMEKVFSKSEEIDGRMFYWDKDKQYVFCESDVKEIAFIHEIGKFYIALSIDVEPSTKRPNNDKVGIDLGIHNPITMHSTNGSVVIRMSKKELCRIAYLERRAGRLQTIMERKYNINEGRITKNYIKVQKKFRITWRKIYNIRLNWRNKCARRICDTFGIIVIDKNRVPTKYNYPEIPNKERMRYINSLNRVHGMSYFYSRLIQTAEKYNCSVFEAPEKTTRTCSCCGYENDKLSLDQRVLHCRSCGLKIDRDLNAAINCYESNIKNLKVVVG